MAIVFDEIPPLPPGWMRVAEHRERWEVRRREAQEAARRLARILVDEWGASRVWLFGSAAGEWVFHDGSDVDVAVDGLDDRTFTRAWSRFEDWEGFQFDIRPRDMFTDERWRTLIPEPVLLAERKA